MSKREEMLKLGDWLTRLQALSPYPGEIEKLIDDALDLTEVRYTRRAEDPVVRSLKAVITRYRKRTIGVGAETDQPLTHVESIVEIKESHRAGTHQDRWIMRSVEDVGFDSLAAKHQPPDEELLPSVVDIDLDSLVAEHQPSDGFSDEDRLAINSDVKEVIEFVILLKSIVQEIKSNPTTDWRQLPVMLQNKNGDDSKFYPSDFLLTNYNKIREILVSNNKGLTIEREMIFPSSYGTQQYHNWKPSGKWIRLPALACYILITFLEMGGQKYIGTCKQCGDVTLSRLKGNLQRETCSDKCRMAHSRQQ